MTTALEMNLSGKHRFSNAGTIGSVPQGPSSLSSASSSIVSNGPPMNIASGSLTSSIFGPSAFPFQGANNNGNAGNNNNNNSATQGTALNSPASASTAPSSSFFQSIMDDNSGCVALRVQNLPRDITPREFKVLFTFAHEFLYSELQKSTSLADNGLPVNVFGYAYFKSFSSASAVQNALDMRSDIFSVTDGALAGSPPNGSTSLPPLKCDIRSSRRSTSHDSLSLMAINPSFTKPMQPTAAGIKPSGSRFGFGGTAGASSGAPPGTAASGAPSGGPQPQSASQQHQPPQQPQAASSVPLDMPPPFSEYYSDNGVFSPTSPRSLFPIVPSQPVDTSNGDYLAPIASGKSLLLESQNRDDEEFNNIVQDPSRFFGFSQSAVQGLQSQPPQQQQQSNGPVSGISNQVGIPPSSGAPPLLHKNSFEGPGGFNKTANPSTGPFGGPGSINGSGRSSISGPSTGAIQPPIGSNVQQQQQAPATNTSAPVTNGPTSASNAPGQWAASAAADKRRTSKVPITKQFQGLSLNSNSSAVTSGAPSVQPASSTASAPAPTATTGGTSGSSNDGAGEGSKVVVPYSPTNNAQAVQIMQSGGRVLPPANPADQNPPCNTLYVGNLPPDTSEDELKELFSSRRGYKRLCFRTKANGPMCFVEFEDVNYATRALEELYGFGLSNSVKGGIRLSFSKNPLGVRSNNNNNNSNNNSRVGMVNGGSYSRYNGNNQYSDGTFLVGK